MPPLARMARSAESWTKRWKAPFIAHLSINLRIYKRKKKKKKVSFGTLSKMSVSLPLFPQACSEFGMLTFWCELSREVNCYLYSALSVKSTLVKQPHAPALFVSTTVIHTVFTSWKKNNKLMFASKWHLMETSGFEWFHLRSHSHFAFQFLSAVNISCVQPDGQL